MFQLIKNDFFFLKQVYLYSKSYVIGEALVAVIEGLLPLLDILLPKFIIDGLIEGSSYSKILFYVAIYVLFQWIGQTLSAVFSELFINLNGHLYSMHFLLMINRKKVDLSLAQLDNPEIHQQAALAEDLIYKGIGIDMINEFFSAITSIVSILSTSLVLIYADYWLVLVIFLFACISAYFNLRMENWEYSQREENIFLTRILNYYIKIMGEKSCTKEMRLYGFANWLMEKYRTSTKYLKKRLHKLYQKSLQIRMIGIFLENIKSGGIYLYLTWLCITKRISVGEFSQFFSAAGQFSESILQLAAFLTNININGKYIESFKEFMDLEDIQQEDANTEKQEIPTENLTLTMVDVGFRYRSSKRMILEHIHYTFEQGKVYVIVGENGAGKTTLIQLLSRLYEPCSGEILLNDSPVQKFAIQDYKNLFGVVFQDFQSFAFTIGENITLSSYDGEDELQNAKIKESLKQAGLWKKIERLPKGLSTYLDKIFYDDGIVLSGGENQKLAFARALFHHPKILILDEPSSALDPISEDELLQSCELPIV